MKPILLLAVSTFLAASVQAGTARLPQGLPSDTLATVGEQTITFSQLNTQLNSTAVVGLSTPTLGTAERRTAMLTLLDKAISVELLYLDALEKGRHKDPAFERELRAFADGVLIGLYRRQYLEQDLQVSEQEIADYVAKHFKEDAQSTDRLRLIAESKLRKQKHARHRDGIRQHLRQDTPVRIHTTKLHPQDDGLRKDSDVIAEYPGRSMTWGETRIHLTTLNSSVDMQRRLNTLNELIDDELMAQKARQAGLHKATAYQSRLLEFNRTRLVNLHRSELIRGMQPTEQELRDYYREHEDNIAFREHRKLQMVILPSREEAQAVKARIDSGKITLFQAALDHSIDPRAKQTMGDFGWVEKGSGFPDLDKLAFSLAPGELGGPVQSPAGWHLLLVTDQRKPRFTDINADETRDATRRLLLKDKLGQFLKLLRKEHFPVVVYEDNLNRLMSEEARWIAAKSKEMQANPERARLILDEMRALVE